MHPPKKKKKSFQKNHPNRHGGPITGRPSPQAAIDALHDNLQTALRYHYSGQIEQAEKIYLTILSAKPDHADALHLLGEIALRRGRHDTAADLISRAIQANPSNADYYHNLGLVYQGQKRLSEAASCYEQAISLNPAMTISRNNLALIMQNQGLYDEAIANFQKILTQDPSNLAALNNLGLLYGHTNRLDNALTCFRNILRINSRIAEVHNNLGLTIQKQGKMTEAEASYRRALEIEPNYAEAHSNLSSTLKELGRLDEAEACCRRALEIKPDSAEAHSNLGSTLKELGRLDEAEACCRRALEIKPDSAEAHNNLGSTLKELSRLDEAEACCRQALKIKPDFAEAHSNLSSTLKELGRLDEAEAGFLQALKIKPDAFQYAIHAHLMPPIIPESQDAVATSIRRYSTGIANLKNIPGLLKDPGKNCNTSSFYLAYNNHNDRSIMIDLNHFFQERIPELTTTAPHIQHWSPPIASGRRIRVGFLSEFLVGHTIGKLYHGYIRHLDRSRFEVVVIHTPNAKQDSFRQRLTALADTSIVLPVGLAAQQATIAAEKLDVLFYPDIGMAPSSYFLAYARLAPVQAVSWGHPDTTGLDTIDYFISAASIEPEDAEGHYSERLIRMNRLPCYYQALLAPTQIPTRITMGLPETGTLYGCPQSLFKFHPEFDAVLAAIAEGDPTGHIVLLEGKYHVWTNLLRARWAKSFPVLMERILFLPHMPLERFMEFIAHLDVLLDPIHFGSGNTLYEGMVYGTPIVTWPGRFMRGRAVAGAYRQMGVEDAPIAACLEEYAPLALTLGRDPERRRALRQASLEAASRELFADKRAIREFETFLEASVEAAGRGEKLPRGWSPSILL